MSNNQYIPGAGGWKTVINDDKWMKDDYYKQYSSKNIDDLKRRGRKIKKRKPLSAETKKKISEGVKRNNRLREERIKFQNVINNLMDKFDPTQETFYGCSINAELGEYDQILIPYSKQDDIYMTMLLSISNSFETTDIKLSDGIMYISNYNVEKISALVKLEEL